MSAPSVGLTTSEVNPTSGAFDELRELIASEFSKRMAENSALTFERLRGVRFGRIERWLLTHAPTERDGGRWLVPSGKPAVDESVGRAIRKLERLELVERVGGSSRLVLLPFGQRVVEQHRAALESGKRIRWPR